MSMRFNTPVFRPQDNKGRALPEAQLFFYENYSTTPKTTYANVALTNPNPHPIIADGAGKFTDIFLGIGDYRVILTDRKGQILWDRNDVSVNDLTADVINDIERQLAEVLNLYRMQNLGEYGVADPDLEKTFTEPNAQYVVYNDQAWWTVSGTPLPYTTDSVTYPDPSSDPNLQLAPNVTFNYVDTGDQDRQKETTGLSEITPVNAGDDLFPLIGQGVRVAGVGLWVVPPLTADSSPLPNPSILDSVPTSENVTVNGGTEVRLFDWGILNGDPINVDNFGATGGDQIADSRAFQQAIDFVNAINPDDGGTITTSYDKKYILDSVDYSGKRVHFILTKGSTISVAGSNPALFCDSSPGFLDVTGLGLMSKEAGASGIGIHHRWGSIRVDGLRGFGAGAGGLYIYLDGTDNTKSINNSYIGGIKFQDCGGIKIEGQAPGVSVETELGDMHMSRMIGTGFEIQSAADVVGGNVIADTVEPGTDAVVFNDIAGCHLGKFWCTSDLGRAVVLTGIGGGVNEKSINSSIDFIGGINSNQTLFINAEQTQIDKMLSVRSKTESIIFGSDCDNLSISSMHSYDGSTGTPSNDIVVNTTGKIAVGQFSSTSSTATGILELPVGNQFIISQLLSAFSGAGNEIVNAFPKKVIESLSANIKGREVGTDTIVGDNVQTTFTINHTLGFVPNIAIPVVRGAALEPVVRVFAYGTTTFQIVFQNPPPVGNFDIDYIVEI